VVGYAGLLIRDRSSLAAVAALLLLTIAATPASGQTSAPRASSKNKPAKAPKVAPPGPNETPSMSAGTSSRRHPGIRLTGEVDFRYGSAHLLADSLHYSESERKVVAEGNVVIELGGSEVSGDRVEVRSTPSTP